MNETQARDAICQMGERLYQRGYLHGTVGNISICLTDAVLITPTDACLGRLDPARLAKVSARGQHLSGDRPSKTIALHQAIVAAARAFDPETQVVIHTHSTHCVALSLNATGPELLPPITPYFVMKVGHVPLVPYHRPGSPNFAQAVAALIRKYAAQGAPIRAVMLTRLGPNVWHDTPAAAMATLEELEETARLMQIQPDTPPLHASALDELRQAFGARW